MYYTQNRKWDTTDSGTPSAADLGTVQRMLPDSTNTTDFAVFTRELRRLYEEDVEDGVGMFDEPRLSELFVLHGYCVFAQYEKDQQREKKKFYRRRREQSCSEALAGARAMHHNINRMLMAGLIASTYELEPSLGDVKTSASSSTTDRVVDPRAKWTTRYLTVGFGKYWAEQKDTILKEWRLPVSERVIKMADSMAEALAILMVKNIATLIKDGAKDEKTEAGKTKKPGKTS